MLGEVLAVDAFFENVPEIPNRFVADEFHRFACAVLQVFRDGKGVLVRTRDVNNFYLLLNQIVESGTVELEAVAPADDDVNSLYTYLIGSEGEQV